MIQREDRAAIPLLSGSELKYKTYHGGAGLQNAPAQMVGRWSSGAIIRQAGRQGGRNPIDVRTDPPFLLALLIPSWREIPYFTC